MNNTSIKIGNYKKIHFIGIGGISMSGLALLLNDSGYTITGSDKNLSVLTDKLSKLGIKIFNSHSKTNITNDIDLVVYTVAVKEDNEELAEARAKHIKIIDRAELLGTIMTNYEYPICIAGVHGKTSTTSMISEVLLNACLDPTISVGAYYKPIDSNFKIGSKKYFVVESCEYYDSFLKFKPYVGVILNIEEDHLDYFSGIDQINNSFNKFAQNINKKGYLIVNNNINDVNLITDKVYTNVITYGNDKADFKSLNVSFNNLGCGSFDVYLKNDFLARLHLKVVGEHNISNALAAFASCHMLNIPTDKIIDGLNSFTGSSRRFEHKGIKNGVTVVDDYAHHPTEIKATLNACINIPKNKLWCVFQPHTYTRTKALFDDFVNCFDKADEIIILDIYAAREKDLGEITSEQLVKALNKKGLSAIYIKTKEKAAEFLLANCIHNDLLITMGAGDVYITGEMFLK